MRGPETFSFWWRWLLAATMVVIGIGAFLVFAPGPARTISSLLFFGGLDTLDSFPEPAVRYVTFAHGVLGAVMIGWGVALALILLGPVRRRQPDGWKTFAVSLAVWYAVDSAFSLYSGFWPNVVLNTVIVGLFALPLWRIRRMRGHD